MSAFQKQNDPIEKVEGAIAKQDVVRMEICIEIRLCVAVVET